MTTKILALTDALGNLVRFELLPDHRFDTVGVEPVLDGVDFGGLIADKAFDSNAIIAELNARGAKIVISQHPRRIPPLKIDPDIYKWRHLIDIDQAWRLSRINGGRRPIVFGLWRQASPRRRRRADRFQHHDSFRIGEHQFVALAAVGVAT